jgi:acetyl-CoA synthetase
MTNKIEAHPVTQEWSEKVLIDAPKYAEMYRRSVEDPDGFWHEEARRIEWIEQNMLDGPPVFEACQPSALGK